MAKVKFYKGTADPNDSTLPEGGIYFRTNEPIIYMRHSDGTTKYYGCYTAGTGLSLKGTVFSVNTGYTTSGHNYAVKTDSSDNLYVSVPWYNTDTTYSAGEGLSLSGTKFSVKIGNTSDTVARGDHTHSITFNSGDAGTCYLTVLEGGNSTDNLKFVSKLPYSPSLNVLGDTILHLNCNTIEVYEYGNGVVIGNKTILNNKVYVTPNDNSNNFVVDGSDSKGIKNFNPHETKYTKYDLCVYINTNHSTPRVYNTASVIIPPKSSLSATMTTSMTIYSTPIFVDNRVICLKFKYAQSGTSSFSFTFEGLSNMSAALTSKDINFTTGDECIYF